MTPEMLDVLHKISVICAMLGGSCALTLFAIQELRPTHHTAVRTVWYFFSLASYTTILVTCWAVEEGAIDSQGGFQGEAGKFLDELLKFILNVNDDILIIAALVSFLIVPQFLSYVLSGLFGCAARPMLIKTGMSFLVWSIVKSFALASGVIVSYVLVGLWNGWPGLNWLYAFTYFSVSLAAISFFSFGVLLNYYQAQTIIAKIHDRTALFRRFHKWATRHSAALDNAQ